MVSSIVKGFNNVLTNSSSASTRKFYQKEKGYRSHDGVVKGDELS